MDEIDFPRMLLRWQSLLAALLETWMMPALFVMMSASSNEFRSILSSLLSASVLVSIFSCCSLLFEYDCWFE